MEVEYTSDELLSTRFLVRPKSLGPVARPKSAHIGLLRNCGSQAACLKAHCEPDVHTHTQTHNHPCTLASRLSTIATECGTNAHQSSTWSILMRSAPLSALVHYDPSKLIAERLAQQITCTNLYMYIYIYICITCMYDECIVGGRSCTGGTRINV